MGLDYGVQKRWYYDKGEACRREASKALELAKQYIAERAQTHPDPIAELEYIGALWGSLLGLGPIPPNKVAIMMVALKIARAWLHPDNDDNWVDIAGWGALGRGCMFIEKGCDGEACTSE